MDALSPAQAARRVVFMKGAQVGGTECGNNWNGFLIGRVLRPGERVALLDPGGRERLRQPRQRQSIRLPLVQKRPHNVRREQREAQQRSGTSTLQSLGIGHLADAAVAALVQQALV
ncbi:hypothetical protein [Falsiroseomonas sp.]|uniref:hypothetical protein n=1 Tax=Falsiroseomonas sp. TaxID=2870721 RepID=UPI0035695AE6